MNDSQEPDPATLLVLSPHLDDAALSCGGAIARATRRGWRAVVLVFFAGMPPSGSLTLAAREFHDICGLGDDAIAVRKVEDQAAMAILSAEARYLRLLESLYRLHPDGSPVYADRSDINDPPGGPEPWLVDAVADAVVDALATWAPRVVLFPLGVGGHVDHLAVHRGALEVHGGVASGQWFAYEDVPYVTFSWLDGWEAEVATAWSSMELRVEEQDWQRKLDAIRCYPSQMAAIFEEPETWAEGLTSYASTVGTSGDLVERYWKRRR